MRRAIGQLVYGLLRVLDRVLQLVVAPRSDQVCFLSIPDHTDNAYYQYQHLVRTRRGLTLVWLVGDLGRADEIRAHFEALTADRPDHGHTLRIEPRRAWRGYRAYLRSAHCFHSQGAYAFSRWAFRRHVVNLWHGMPIKAIGLLNQVTPSAKGPYGTVHVATSHAFRYVIAAAFGAEPATVEVSGLPRCDALLHASARSLGAEEVRRRLDLPPDRRLVVWMPTYRVQDASNFVDRRTHWLVETSWSTTGPRSFLDDLTPGLLQAIDDACGRYGCTVLVKLHPLDSLNAAGPRPDNLRHVRFLTSPTLLASRVQLYDLLACSDGLLSDISSVLIDYLVAQRPIGLLGFSEQDYDRELLLPLRLLLDSARFHAISAPADVEAYLAEVAMGGAVASTDLQRVLYERFDEPAAELLARRVGL